MAGYSTNSLFKKLGLKTGISIKLIHAPGNYADLLGDTMDGLSIKAESAEDLDFIHLFTNSLSELQSMLPQLKAEIKTSGTIWISWYKKSAKKETELTDNIIRDLALAAGLVDVKVCAIDEEWSGLKLVYRLKDR